MLNRTTGWMLAVLCLIMGIWADQALAEHKSRVLVLHSYHKGLSWTDAISKGIETTFSNADASVEIEYAYMDAKRVFNQAYLHQLVELYRVKYKGRSFRAIICSDDHAFNFLLRHGKALFGNTPVVFCGVNFFRDEMLAHAPNFTGVVESFDMLTTINTALELQPDAKRLVAIGDQTVSGKANKERFQEIIPKLSRPVDVTIMDNLSMQEAQTHAGKLSPQDILIWLVFTADRNGEVFSFEESTRMISAHSNAPMYAFWDFNLGHGIVGGMLTSGVMQGRRAAELTLRILGGEAVENIPIVKKSPNQFMFDYNQLKRFNIKLSRLPAGSLVINQPQTFYAEHKQVVWIVIALICAMLTIIVLLLYTLSYRKRITSELRKHDERYRQYFEGDLSGVYMVTAAGELIMCNEVFAKMLGFDTSDDVIGTNLIQYYKHPQRRQELVSQLIKDRRLEQYDIDLVRRNGKTIQCLVNAVGHFDDHGNLLEIQGYLMDVTRTKSLEAQLLHAQKMESIGTMAGGVAHDFNNLLMGIMGNASFLSMTEGRDPEDLKRLRYIEQLVQSGADLTRQLLGFAKGGKYEVRPTDLNRLIMRSIEMFSRTHKDIKVTTELADRLKLVEVDRTQIDQVLYNLYLNAWQAMENYGHLTIRTASCTLKKDSAASHGLEPGSYVEVTVQDNGIGMDDDVQQRIFDPFFTTKERERGTGLGLASAYGIIQNHAGAIAVQSRPGEGARFTILLPASEHQREEKTPESSPRMVKGTERILLVDDEQGVLDAVGSMLRHLGYTVQTAADGKAAIKAVHEYRDRIDLVILDMVMPGIGGKEVFEQMKAIAPDIKVLLSSGYTVNGQAACIIERGCRGFIQKPFTMRQLSQKLRGIFENDPPQS